MYQMFYGFSSSFCPYKKVIFLIIIKNNNGIALRSEDPRNTIIGCKMKKI